MGKRGPASKGEYSSQTAVLSTRITPELRARLEAEVEKSRKTLSREIEHRLRRSFIDDDKISEAFGSRRNYALMRAISMIVEMWHDPSDPSDDWSENPIAYDLMCKKIDIFLRSMRPSAEEKKLTELEEAIAVGKSYEDPALLILALQKADLPLSLTGQRRDQVISLIKGDLGSLCERPVIYHGTADQLRELAQYIEETSAPRSAEAGSGKRTK